MPQQTGQRKLFLMMPELMMAEMYQTFFTFVFHPLIPPRQLAEHQGGRMIGDVRLGLMMIFPPKVYLSLFDGDLQFVCGNIGCMRSKNRNIFKYISAFSSIITNIPHLTFTVSIPLLDDICSKLLQSMFKQLPYFHYLEHDLKAMQELAKDLNLQLADAYTPADRVFCSLKGQIDAILAEEEHLSSVISVILEQVASDTFIPVQPDSQLLAQVSPSTLPQWFPHVLEKEYERAKSELDSFARKLSGLHQLEQKRKAMRGERQALETLYRRNIAISAQKAEHFTDIDIMQDVEHLRNRIKHVRKTFLYFGNQVAGKIREFVEQLIDRSLNFGRAQSPPSLQRSGSKASDVFRRSDNIAKVRSYDLIGQLPEESFKAYDQARSIWPRNPLKTFRETLPKVDCEINKYEDYYGRSKELRMHQKSRPINQMNQGLTKNCKNHEENSTLHRHTCQKGQSWLRGVKSQQRLNSSKYDYCKFMLNGGFY